jgi:XTP/dITP diphosphohydrolase
MALVIATRNANKLREIRRIFSNVRAELISLESFDNAPEVTEDGNTFEENAIKKARSASEHTGLWAMADDSGLEVEALEGAPGIYSARYSGLPVSYERNNKKLLRELKENGERSARFVCAVALCGPGGDCDTVRGTCEGRIAHGPAGDNGFGYDPLFIPEGESRTFAQMSDDEKNRISHRFRAFDAARRKWADKLS